MLIPGPGDAIEMKLGGAGSDAAAMPERCSHTKARGIGIR